MGQQLTGIAGAAIGYAIGGPGGAQIGFAIGSAAGAYLFPMKVPGPRMGEVPIQTSRDGVTIPIGWGIIYTAGNVIQTLPPQVVTRYESQGKGGDSKGAQVEKTYIYRTFAIGVCRSMEGPIKGIRRIWENNKLVYGNWLESNSFISYGASFDPDAFGNQITIYLGTEDQMPDPELEADTGVGNQPAYRGLAYIVWNNYDVTEFGGSIPQYKFEVEVHGGELLTTHIYPIEARDTMQVGCNTYEGALLKTPQEWVILNTTFDTVSWASIRYEIYIQDEYVMLNTDLDDVSWSSIAYRIYIQDEYVMLNTTFDEVTWRRARIDQIMVPEKLQIGCSTPTGSMTSV